MTDKQDDLIKTLQAGFERMARQNTALTRSNKARDAIFAGLDRRIEQAREAVNTLQSEREVNAILTTELAQLQTENERLRAENKRLLRDVRTGNDSIKSLCDERDKLLLELAQAKRDSERLDSGCILISSFDEFGRAQTLHTGINLREAIDAALQKESET